MRKMSAAQPKLEISAHVMAKATTSVNRLAGYHTPNSASRFLHISLATGDQMHVGVVNRLPSSCAAVHADIEAAYRSIFIEDTDPHFVQKLTYGAFLWLE